MELFRIPCLYEYTAHTLDFQLEYRQIYLRNSSGEVFHRSDTF